MLGFFCNYKEGLAMNKFFMFLLVGALLSLPALSYSDVETKTDRPSLQDYQSYKVYQDDVKTDYLLDG